MVYIGQVIITSIRTELGNKELVIEALCGAKFKFSGRQRIYISKNWAFTKFSADDLENVTEKWYILDGWGVTYYIYTSNGGPLDKWQALHS